MKTIKLGMMLPKGPTITLSGLKVEGLELSDEEKELTPKERKKLLKEKKLQESIRRTSILLGQVRRKEV